MSLTETPRANRLHIGIFGKRNSGKSSLTNALTGQQAALVSDVAGTTTDPVYKAMEVHGIGPCVFIDTAGFDDEGALGGMRVERTQEAAKKTDVALLLFSGDDFTQELAWLEQFQASKTPVIAVVNKADEQDAPALAARVLEESKLTPIAVSAKTGEGVESLRAAIIRAMPADFEQESITGDLCAAGDLVLLVMPQDIQAPKGRLILPQVQMIRELLDKKCLVSCCTGDNLEASLASLAHSPKLIITDSQLFRTVYAKKPPETPLTSFSVLLAAYKGDISYFTESAKAADRLTEHSRVLIAEACTHAPLTEDIGREKIPRMLRARVGQGLTIEFARGTDFPADLTPYDLVIHCGACMFNRKYVLSRVSQAKDQGVPMTNYGLLIAHFQIDAEPRPRATPDALPTW